MKQTGGSTTEARFKHAGHRHSLGYYKSKEEAACVYDLATIWRELKNKGTARITMYFHGPASNLNVAIAFAPSAPTPSSAPAGEPARLTYNFPQLGLATDAALLRRLRGLADVAALKSFLRSWAAEELPALLAQLSGGGNGSAQTAASGELRRVHNDSIALGLRPCMRSHLD